MSKQRLHRFILVVFAAVVAAATLGTSAASQTIALNLSLDDAASVDATVTVTNVLPANGTATISGTVKGNVTIAGISGTIAEQPITLTATATCKAGAGSLTLTTSPINASLSNGTQATVGTETLTVSATCGRTPTLTVMAAPATATLTDGTTVTTSQCTATVSSRPSTSLGATICSLQTQICDLATAIANGDTSTVVTLLNEILNSTLKIA
jgi:hypothetical protein